MKELDAIVVGQGWQNFYWKQVKLKATVEHQLLSWKILSIWSFDTLIWFANRFYKSPLTQSELKVFESLICESSRNSAKYFLSINSKAMSGAQSSTSDSETERYRKYSKTQTA